MNAVAMFRVGFGILLVAGCVIPLVVIYDGRIYELLYGFSIMMVLT